MDESGILEKLCLFGLTRQEALLYLCLFQGGEMSGYEAAKQTGISRSNAYSGLAGLVEKGAAYVMEGSTTKYVAIPAAEFCNNKIRSLEREQAYLEQHLKAARKEAEGYVTIAGYKHIVDKLYHMMEQAEYRIYLAAPIEFVENLKVELLRVTARGIKLVILTDGHVPVGEAITYLTEKRERQLRLIIDSAYVLTGEIDGTNQDTCLYTGQKNFVNVFKEALRNEIKLIARAKPPEKRN